MVLIVLSRVKRLNLSLQVNRSKRWRYTKRSGSILISLYMLFTGILFWDKIFTRTKGAGVKERTAPRTPP